MSKQDTGASAQAQAQDTTHTSQDTHAQADAQADAQAQDTSVSVQGGDITLKMSQNIDELNTLLDTCKVVQYGYKVSISGTNKRLSLHAPTRRVLESAGLHELKQSYSYKQSPAVYNALLAVLESNSDVFTRIDG